MTPAATTKEGQVGDWQRLGAAASFTTVASVVDPPELYERDRLEALLQLARLRFKGAVDAENNRREQMLIDLQFRCGKQWDEGIKLKREQQGRPCLTINRIPGFLKHVENNMRQSRSEIKIDPVGDGADEEIAEIRQGLIRHIQINSRADIAYDAAFENMATMGLGFVRVVDGWAAQDSFDKDLFVEWVPNTFSVYFDPGARKPDWSDAKFAFVVEDISIAEFRQRFPNSKNPVGLDSFRSIGDHSPWWMPGGKIRIAEYFHIEEQDDTLCQMSDGSTILFSKLQALAQDSEAEGSVDADAETEGAEADAQPGQQVAPPAPTIVRTRPTKVPYVMWTLMNGLEVLKESRWAGKYIPLIPFIGNQIDLDGERILVGMVRYAREAQRMFNYMYSCFVEAVALAPKAPWVAEFDQIQEFREIWERANTDLFSVLPFRGKSIDGHLLPPPARNHVEPPIQAFVEGLKLADNNLKATFNIYDASLGQKGPQESGIAINSRKVESDLATYDWIDNFNRGVAYLGMVLDDLLPHYYNTPGRIVQIVREDKTSKSVLLNQEHQDEKTGDTKIFDLSKGKYATTIGTGPSHETRRQEAAQSMMELAKVYAPLMQVAGPTIVREMDWPGKDAIAAQLEKAMPPELRAEDPDAPKQDPAVSAQKVAQLSEMVQQLSKLLQEATDHNSADERKEQYATYREAMKQETAVVVADIKTASQQSMLLAQETFEHMKRLQDQFQQMLMAAQPQQPGAQQPGQPASPQSSAPESAAALPPQAQAQPVPAGSPAGGPPAG